MVLADLDNKHFEVLRITLNEEFNQREGLAKSGYLANYYDCDNEIFKQAIELLDPDYCDENKLKNIGVDSVAFEVVEHNKLVKLTIVFSDAFADDNVEVVYVDRDLGAYQ